MFPLQPGECSRTSGLMVKQSGAVKQPFKQKSPEKPLLKEVASFSTSPRKQIITSELRKHLKAGGSKSSSDMTKFSLKVAERHTFQYARWDVLKEKFRNEELEIFFHIRPGIYELSDLVVI